MPHRRHFRLPGHRHAWAAAAASLRPLGRSLRGAAALSAVAAVVAGAVLTGHSAVTRDAAVTAAARPQPLAETMVRPDVTPVLGLFGLHAPAPRTTHAQVTRAERRTPLHRWVRPNDGPFSSPFGMRWGRLHAGIDIAGGYGSTIVAATDGCISYAGAMSGYGEVMQISDWDGTETVYGHMSSFIRTSGCVHAGEPIARVGSGGDATGPHLHFEVHVAGVPVDPVRFLARRGVYV